MDDRLDREALELHMLTSLARSQRALSRIIESVADQVEASHEMSEEITQNLKAISSYQRVLICRITGFRPHKKRRGIPAPPWFTDQKEGLLHIARKDRFRENK